MSILIVDPGSPSLVNLQGLTREQRSARRRELKKQYGIQDKYPRTMTISNSDPLDVPEQRSYSGPGVISDDEADAQPSDPVATLSLLNELMGTDHTAESCPKLFAALQTWIADGSDFGTIYARVRCSASSSISIDRGIELAATRLREFEEKRSKALDPGTNRIIHPHLPPRRIWDLVSNRVVPHDGSESISGAVSHSWMADPQRMDTPINNHEWPVPIPRDTTLARVRVELLNLGFSYVWLDVLCLRQKGTPDKESLRLDEWKVDVPTIGAVYHGTAQIIHYYSGLGRPFQVGDLNSERHWINRAWTLQEVSSTSIIAGLAAGSPPLPSSAELPDPVAQTLYRKIGDLTVHVTTGGETIFPILEAMRFRVGTSELDKVAGLAYRLMAHSLPPYIVGQKPDDAWDALVAVMTTSFRGNLFLIFPHPGLGRYKWYPSWSQITDRASSLPSQDLLPYETVDHDMVSNVYSVLCYRFEQCKLVGLNATGRRQGVASIPTPDGRICTLTAFASHQQAIPDGEYTLIAGWGFSNWVVGRSVPGQPLAFEKISVFRVPVGAREFEADFGSALADHRSTSQLV